MNGIKIRGTGRGVPTQVVSNRDLEQRIDTSDEWITSRTGIRTRHYCSGGETFSAITAAAAREALAAAGFKILAPEEVYVVDED